MRRIKTNKRGFTLTEIILVIAIIVILTGALAAGIAIDLNRYKQYLANLNTTGGGNWEGAARGRVAGMFGTLDPAPEYNGEPSPMPTADATEEADETEAAEATEVPAPPTEKAGDPTEAPATSAPTQAPPTVKPADPTQAPSGGGGGPVASNNQSGKTGNYNYSVSASSDWSVSKNGNKITFTRKDGSGSLTFSAQSWGNLVYELSETTGSVENNLGVNWGGANGNATNRQVGNNGWGGTSFWESQGIYLYH